MKMKKTIITAVAVLLMSAIFSGSAFAAYDVTISNSASSGGSWSGGTPDVWTTNATGSNVSVADIQTKLASGDVTIDTGSSGAENGDIIVNSPLTWSANTLTLSAARDVQINAVMTANNTSTLTMTTTSGTVRCGFASVGGFAGRVDFFLDNGATPRFGTGFLTINGSDYTVITALGAEGLTTGTDLQGMSGALGTNYALGANIDASATSGWNSRAGFAPIGNNITQFTGIFDGLGHTVNRLYINRSSSGSNYSGLFGYATNALRNVGLEKGFVSGISSTENYSGGLAGRSAGSISNSYNTGFVSGISSTENYSGGLAGTPAASAIRTIPAVSAASATAAAA